MNKWILYINRNDKFIRQTSFNKKLNVVKYWSFNWSDSKFKILEIKNAITKFNFNYKKHTAEFETDLLWKHNIINLTWVISFCYDIWLKTSEIKKYLKNIKAPKKTLNVIKKKYYILIDDTYNLSEDWLYAWLDALNSFKWDKILVMDDILELWNKSEWIHYAIWEYIARRNKVSKILFCGINYKESFIKWLLEWGFNSNNLLNNLDNPKKDSIIFESRKNIKNINDNTVITFILT